MVCALVAYFTQASRIFSATAAELAQVPGIRKKLIQEIAGFHDWATVERDLEKLTQLGAHIVTYRDPDYPPLLKNINDYPAFLYVKGKINPDEVYIAIVGSRRATNYGILTAERFARGLAQVGLAVVSGMARGIDAAAHRAAIAVRGRTVAVLGSGLDIIYPPEHRDLYNAISTHGAVISEFPLGTPPRATNFPYRNRLISGLSWGVVVVEATDKSGSLITARLAAEQGRGVFAVPGEIDAPGSRGTHKLLKEGATIVERTEDILEEIAPQISLPTTVTSETKKRRRRHPQGREHPHRRRPPSLTSRSVRHSSSPTWARNR